MFGTAVWSKHRIEHSGWCFWICKNLCSDKWITHIYRRLQLEGNLHYILNMETLTISAFMRKGYSSMHQLWSRVLIIIHIWIIWDGDKKIRLDLGPFMSQPMLQSGQISFYHIVGDFRIKEKIRKNRGSYCSKMPQYGWIL